MTTPLQMAVVTSAIANGGYVYRPRLYAREPGTGRLLRRMTWSKSTVELVRNGMHDVVESSSGTGKRARIEGVEMAGKTGTAEFGPKDQVKNYTWMTLFAPYQTPRYAVAMLIEEGTSGGQTVAPKMKDLMARILSSDGTI